MFFLFPLFTLCSGRKRRASISWGVYIFIHLAFSFFFMEPKSSAHPCKKKSNTVEFEFADVPNEELIPLAGREPVKSNWVPPGEHLSFGRAQLIVHAPQPLVLGHVTAFNQYALLAPDKFKTSRIVGKEGGKTDVYMQIPVLHGWLTLWQIIRFDPPLRSNKGTLLVAGNFLKGNIRDIKVSFELKAVNATTTLITCNLLLVLSFPTPQEKLDEELRDAAGDAVNGIREKAEAQFRSEKKDAVQ